MGEVNKNLKILRENLNLSQKAFGEKLKVDSTTISKLESDTRRNVTDRMILQICETFDVNERWLRYGEGEMFKGSDDFELASMMGKMFSGDDNFLKNVFLTFARLNDSEREVVKKIIKELNKE
ncbi:TPA: helix-turn-helix domain-containing protein [Clostridioides difficile]|nr:helix-turn-helix transcriptional regulator [Clostridioides difficile]